MDSSSSWTSGKSNTSYLSSWKQIYSQLGKFQYSSWPMQNNGLILLLFELSQANHQHYLNTAPYTDAIEENSTFTCNNKPRHNPIQTARVSTPASHFKQTNICKSYLPLAKPAMCILICTGSLGPGQLIELMFPFCELSMLSLVSHDNLGHAQQQLCQHSFIYAWSTFQQPHHEKMTTHYSLHSAG